MKIAALFVCLFTSCAMGQTFSVLPHGPSASQSWAVPGPRPAAGSVVLIDLPALVAGLSLAPAQRLDANLADYGVPLAIPHPSGAMLDCRIAESPVMEPALQARFPQIRTYIVRSLDGSASGRLELSPRGLTAMLRTMRTDGSGDTWMIDPWQSGDASTAVAYWLRDLPGGGDWTCRTLELPHEAEPEPDHMVPGMRGAHTLRTVRLAVACTGEYGAHQSTIQGHAPNLADPLAAIVTVVSRANVVYEADLAVHYNLVANNDQIVFFNPDTDPYPSGCDGAGGADCSGGYLSANIATLNSVIGESNFDLGHLLTRVFGGVAYLNALCTGNKAGGISGIPRGGDVDPLSALVAIHEMGHQLGANHTFSGTRGRCFGNVHLSTAWEAGSGSSPMAYAGGCPVGDAPPTDNIVQFADPFFHHGSLLEMQNLLSNRSCPVQTASGNSVPVLGAYSTDHAIPPETPFVLEASATDADIEALTYSWEQFDSGVARPLSGTDAVDSGAGALFRIFPPVASSSRTFPKMADILSGVPTPGERLPTVTGVTRQFRVLVRDNHPAAGGIAISDLVNISIAAGTTPFAVSSPTEGQTLQSGLHTVSWSVGGTHLPPISCSSVTITLSNDDGETFGSLLGSFPNTGAAVVTLPVLAAAAVPARLRIDADGQVFFAVSRPFTLERHCVADFDGAGGVGVPDLFAFLTAWFANDPSADIDGVAGIAVPDIFAFLSLWFAGCAG